MTQKHILLLCASLLFLLPIQAQRRNNKNAEPVTISPPHQEPKLVVGIVVDQMRYDYLTRFWNHYGEGGFKKLVNDGFLAKNHHFNYAPTTTAPGHASVYTGTSPAYHGVIGNDWYDKDTDLEVYCVGIDTVTGVGTTSEAGKMAPYRLQTTTVTDQLRLHTQFRGKTIAVAIKDRGAVIPGGHTANAAYWFEGGSTGNWISSTYYMQELPSWVIDWNASDAVEAYKKPWNTLKPISEYGDSGTDDNFFEGKFKSETATIFPHDLPALWDANGAFDILKSTPYGNSITTDFALKAMKEEALGKDQYTDFLAISYSSTDYVGHKYGVNSVEVEDTYLRLDRDIARLLKELEAQVGAGNFTLFLSADHGAIHVPNFLKSKKIPAGYLDGKEMREKLNTFLSYEYGTQDLVKSVSGFQVFLDYDLLKNLDLEADDVQEEIAYHIAKTPGISQVFTADQIKNHLVENRPPTLGEKIKNGWHPKRSGDVIYVQEPGWTSYSFTGSTHGSPMIYDTHVPLILYGMGVQQGSTARYTAITDIAPTISVLLGIAFPNGCTGSPIPEALKN